MEEVLLLVGTRPEAVKAAPVALCLAEHPHLSPAIIHSGQDVAMVEQALAPFGLRPGESLRYHRETGGQAAFWRRIPVVHLEAGLRTGDLAAPFPEEANRQLVARVAALHLAPTPSAAAALAAENLCGGEVVVTGNTVVDAAPRIAALEAPAANPDLVAVDIQEEAPSSGVPVLVPREVTERMEAVHAGCAWLVGTDRTRILLAADEMLHTRLRIPVNSNPFGDDNAAHRVCASRSPEVTVGQAQTLRTKIHVTDSRWRSWCFRFARPVRRPRSGCRRPPWRA